LNASIAEETKKVTFQLEQVEPAVQDAKAAVKNIKRQQLVEIRTMGNPPKGVKMCLESICLLLGEPTTDWKQVRQVIMRDNFISTIINFNTDDIRPSTRKQMKEKFLSNPDYNYESINRASLACGPLVKWATAQLSYADMLQQVGPLRNKLRNLQENAVVNREKAEDVESTIMKLEESIAKYTDEYAVLISDVQAIKQELNLVDGKVNRSMSLLESLSQEKERWETTSVSFKTQMSTIPGDCLLSAAFITYAGYFDQQMRKSLFYTWQHHLTMAGINFRGDLARSEYLSAVDERLKWQQNSLPVDDLCVENAIMLKRFNRYPLIIDPSGQATEFILKQYAVNKIQQTSFLDDAFRKNLESSLRFGNPLLVQDVESYDPILNPVLNRELRRTGGRTLITIGDQDIDLSPVFTIFLTTRDPTADFPPDLCSRVTFVNFTVTRGSLQSQCLNEALKAERPDVDKKRSDLLKLQGEYQLRLRELEKELLDKLNNVQGRILDDDSVITALETLKKEADQVQQKVLETDVIMGEVTSVSMKYEPLARSCSDIFFTLESMSQLHFLYQYSLRFFLSVYHTVLYENPQLNTVRDYEQRLQIITQALFKVVYNRVARSLLHQDRITFSMLLSRIYLRGFSKNDVMSQVYDFFLKGQEQIVGQNKSVSADIQKLSDCLSEEQMERLQRLSQLPAFKQFPQKISESREEFSHWLKSSSPESQVAMIWTSTYTDENGAQKAKGDASTALESLVITQCLRSDRVKAAADLYVRCVMGDQFMQDSEQEIDLAKVVQSEVKSNEPVLMCALPGYDASTRVVDVATQLNVKLTSIAIGSSEGFELAEKSINSAAKSGVWVMLKNVHLAPSWLVQLEKKLHTLTPHVSFRLFLTMEVNPKVPVNLLRAGRVFVFEPPPGVKANLLATFNRVATPSRVQKSPTERARLYFLLAWFNAVVQERLRYAPLGWSKKYEFNDSDLRCACDTIDTWVDQVGKGRDNIPPEKMPWNAIRTLISQAVYGGRIDNEFDQRLLNTFLERMFTVASFENEFALVRNFEGDQITMPEQATHQQDFVDWVERLPDKQTPAWLGLPNNAEKLILTTQGMDLTRNLLRTQLFDEDDDTSSYETISRNEQTDQSGQRPLWMRNMLTSATHWKSLLHKTRLQNLVRTATNIKDPLFRFFEREVKLGVNLLKNVQKDLQEVVEVCEGNKKQTNHHRSLLNTLGKSLIPKQWNKYKVPDGWSVIQWIGDFSERITQLNNVVTNCNNLKNLHVWLGGLFIPEAYITATRQYVAQSNNRSLEELVLRVKVTGDSGDKLDKHTFAVTGLLLQGASCNNNRLSLSPNISTKLPTTMLSWVPKTDMNSQDKNEVVLPVYRNGMRSDLLFTLSFGVNGEESSFYERGVALLAAE